MSDQNPDQSLAGDMQSDAALPAALGGPSLEVENFLSIEKVLSAARLTRRVARICLRADLEGELLDILAELASLVDADGKPIDDPESSLADSRASRAAELQARAQDVRARMVTETYSVWFEAMDDDKWDAFESAHRAPDGKPKNIRDYNNRIISATAVSQVWTVEQVESMRKKLTGRQMLEMANKAYEACTQGGLEVPKLPAFSLVQKPTGQ